VAKYYRTNNEPLTILSGSGYFNFDFPYFNLILLACVALVVTLLVILPVLAGKANLVLAPDSFLLISITGSLLAGLIYFTSYTRTTIGRDGSLKLTRNVLGLPLYTRSYLWGSYVEIRRSWVKVDNPRYLVSVVDRSGRQFTILILKTPPEIGEFKYLVSDLVSADVFC